MERKRLDLLLFERGLCKSREEAQALILAGSVWSNEKRMETAGQKVAVSLPLEVRSRALKFSSRAGYKLEHAIEAFNIDVANRACADIGASTGGFTDCLLQKGASQVLAVDVGYGQLDMKLRQDPRVKSLEKTNARYLSHETITVVYPDFPIEKVSLITFDLSFISLKKVVPAVHRTFSNACDYIFLFKPQFEVGRKYLKKGGVVEDEKAIENELSLFQKAMSEIGLFLSAGPEKSPLPGKKSGNLELILYYKAKG